MLPRTDLPVLPSAPSHPPAPDRPGQLPSPPPAWRFFLLVALLGAVVGAGALALWRRQPAVLFVLSAGYLSYEVGLNVLLVAAAWYGLEQRGGRRTAAGGLARSRARHDAGRPAEAEAEAGAAPAPSPAAPLCSVLIAAHNEASCIVDTIESVFAQDLGEAGGGGGGGRLEIIVASDGSTDDMVARLAARYGRGREPRLEVLALPKVGKAGALNAALARARAGIVVTLDADTRLAPGALAAVVERFARAPEVVSAGGFVYVRNVRPGGPWITRYQYWEYVKNFLWRVGLVQLGVCLQVSGAFGAFRTGVLRELGGFDPASLVEDYEIIYRLHERFRRAGRAYRVDVIPGAVAFTEGPESVAAFVNQRTRWFTGFLQTLWQYRRLVGDPRMGRLGGFMLPVKCVDAILPLWGYLSLGLLVAAAATRSGPGFAWNRAALDFFLVKWTVDVGLGALLWWWHDRLFPERRGRLGRASLAWCVLTESWLFSWFRQVAVLNAYSWFVRRERRWHQPRWHAAAPGGQG